MAIQCPKCQFDNPEETLFCGKCGIKFSSPDDLSVKHTETLQAPREDLTTGATFAGRYQIVEATVKKNFTVPFPSETCCDLRSRIYLKISTISY